VPIRSRLICWLVIGRGGRYWETQTQVPYSRQSWGRSLSQCLIASGLHNAALKEVMGEVQHSINYYLYLVLCTSKIKIAKNRSTRAYGEVIRIGWDQDKTTLILRTLLIPSPGAPSESERVLDSTWIPSIRQRCKTAKWTSFWSSLGSHVTLPVSINSVGLFLTSWQSCHTKKTSQSCDCGMALCGWTDVRSPGMAEGWCIYGVELIGWYCARWTDHLAWLRDGVEMVWNWLGGIALIELSVWSPGVAEEWCIYGVDLIGWHCTRWTECSITWHGWGTVWRW